MTPLILVTHPEDGYELIDSGHGEKLERYGSTIISRPDPQALWPKYLGIKEWLKADAEFSKTEEKSTEENTKKSSDNKSQKNWTTTKKTSWPIQCGDLTFVIKLTSFKHTGIFPEHVSHWHVMKKMIVENTPRYNRPISVLNMFAYTGGATMTCLKAGAHVTHVDASRSALNWTTENIKANALEQQAENSLRLVLEDALVFAHKELKRGKKYDAIIMDPPAFGRGAKGEIWKIEEKMQELLEVAVELLSDTPLFFIVNGYAAGYSAIGYANALEAVIKARTSKNKALERGVLEMGELTIEASSNKRLLPAGIFARWRAI